MKVTVVTVCFNAKEDLKETMDSVLAQTYGDMEYIVVDGGSEDGTQDLLERYEELFAKQEKSFCYVSEKDSGTYDAMNKGCMMAKGEWINYMNAGDSFFSDDTLSSFFSHEIEGEAEVLYGNTLQVYDFGSGVATPKDFGNEVMPFCHQSSFVRRNIMQRLLFNTSYRIVADHDLFYRIHFGGG